MTPSHAFYEQFTSKLIHNESGFIWGFHKKYGEFFFNILFTVVSQNLHLGYIYMSKVNETTFNFSYGYFQLYQ